mmetsp:Transcript_23890/g.55422  ORF Transcript_23890/g.55422 Transcript_23890/m.55422 type:complete len:253 (+) Transcript_23890:1465-2223(+)
MLVLESQVSGGADGSDRQIEVAHHLAYPRVDKRRLDPWVGADEQQRVRLLDAGDGRVEDVVGSQIGGERRRAVRRRRAERIEEVFRTNEGLDIDERPGETTDPLRRGRRNGRGGGGERLLPGDSHQHALLAQERSVEALPLQTIDGVTGLVRDPLLVDGLVEARLHAHHLTLGGVDADCGRAAVKDVDRSRRTVLPGPSTESVRLRSERSDGAQVDDVAAHFRSERLLDVRANLHRIAAADGAEHVHAGDFL